MSNLTALEIIHGRQRRDAWNRENYERNLKFGGRKARREWERQETKRILRSNKVLEAN